MKKRGTRGIPRAVTIEAWLFLITLAATVWLYQAGFVAELVRMSVDLGPHLGALIAGAAFSTFVTTPFAVAGFLSIGSTLSVPTWQIALSGAIGATIVDLLLIKSLRSPLALIIVRGVTGNDTESFKRRIGKSPALRWLAASFGSILIATPFPTDELGVMFFSASGLRTWQIAPLVFASDFVGVYLMVTAGHFLGAA